jgi:chaperonin GroES
MLPAVRRPQLFIDADALLGVFDGGNVNAASFKPLGDRVLVVCAEQATETTTGIALAVDEDTESNQGEVIAVGPGTYATNGKLQPVTVAAGESVVYARYTGAEAKFDGKRYIVVSEADCIAKW